MSHAEPPCLEDQVKALRHEKSALYTENWALREAIKRLTDDKWEEAISYGHPYLTAKINRQRWAINAIQWRGWEPEYIIHEQLTPEDFYAVTG